MNGMPRAWTLLTPGPANTAERVRGAALRGDISHRQEEFYQLLLGLRQKLLAAAGLPRGFEAVVLTGSGTAAVEAAVASLVTPGRTLLVVSNGVYGERIAAMAAAHDMQVVEVRAGWTEHPDLDEVQRLLAQDPSIEVVAAVHHETTVGLLNPVAELGALTRSAGRYFLVDVISSLGAEELDLSAIGADVAVATANKAFHGLPGVSCVYLSPRALEQVRRVPPRSLYLSLRSYLDLEARGEVPFTPAIQVAYALDEALDLLAAEGGIPARALTYRRRAGAMQSGLEAAGLELLVRPEWRSHAVTAAFLPAGVGFEALYEAMRREGFIIYAGQGHLNGRIFRVATMGELPLAEIERFTAALADCVRAGLPGAV